MTDFSTGLVSVIVPNYNGKLFLERCIESVLAQSYTNWELIICDDCSTDNSIELISQYADSRIKEPIRLEANQGAAVARNLCIERAKGEYISFLDNDDYWLPEKLERQIDFMKKEGHLFTYTDYFLFKNDRKKRISSKRYVKYPTLLRNNYILTSTVIYNAKQLGKIYMANIRKRQDWSLFINIIRKSGVAYNLPVPLAAYRRHSDSLSSNKLDLLGYNFNFYHQVLGFSKLKSAVYMIQFLFFYFIKKFKEAL